MDHRSFQFPVIGPLVTRHAEDAAHYWSQLDRAAVSPQIGFDKLLHFTRLHDAHLKGLEVAGPDGWKPGLTALERWQKAGEAYVCTRIALRQDDLDRLDGLLRIVARRPGEMLRGVISALAWDGEHASAAIRHWSRPEADPLPQVAALRAAALLGASALQDLAAPLDAYFSATAPEVRAAACRATASAERADAIPLLRPRLASTDPAERAEAAISLLHHGEAGEAWSALRDAVLAQANLHADATGWYRTQAARRLRRWTMELAWATDPGATDVDGMLQQLPPRTALTFGLVHGDLANLPFVASHTATPGVERYAGWVWQTLTGIDLSARGWLRPEPDPSTLDTSQLITEARLDADDGLPSPDPGPITAHAMEHARSASKGKRVLFGRELDFAHALDVLEHGSQAVRILAARALRGFHTGVQVDARAPASCQHKATLALRRLTRDGSAP